MFKIMTILGTRPEIIKMSRVVFEFDQCFKQILVYTGQNYDYELSKIFFDELNFRKPDFFLNANDINAAQTIASVIKKSDKLMRKEKPDAVVIYGDTNSCLAVIAAKRLQIPVFHMEAGNRCFDQRVPEELNRKIVDHLSDINMVLTEHARRYLMNEGIRPETIFKTGSHMKEILHHFKDKIDASTIIKKLKLIKNKYFVVSIHREENVDYKNNFKEILETLESLQSEYNMPLIVSTHPRTNKILKQTRYKDLNKNIVFMKPFGFYDYIKLQMNSLCVISDSGTITEESSILKFNAIMVRNNHERPEGMDHGTLIMSGLNKDKVLDSINILLKQKLNSYNPRVISDYDEDFPSKKIPRIVQSYIHYVNKFVWHKE